MIHTLHTASEAAQWLGSRVSGVLRTDSRMVEPGDAFIAWPGAATDGRRYVMQALQQGASACLMEALDHEPWLTGVAHECHSNLAVMPGLKAQTGWVADAYYQHPSQALNVLAVTGTNGKTSTAWWLAQALSSPVLGQACGLVGTLGVGQLPHLVSTGMTTPDPVLMQRQFREFADQGVRHCAIEASSIGLAEHRLDGTHMGVAVFTNFTQDHLDYHGDMGRYWAAKAALFAWPGLHSAVINIDDAQGAQLARQLSTGEVSVWTCSRRGPARLQAVALPHPHGIAFEVHEGHEVHTLRTHLLGDYNIDNLLGVMGAMRAMGIGLAQAVQACTHLTSVPGRMQAVSLDGSMTQEAQALQQLPMVVVDYAHTPDAVSHALLALRSMATARGGQLWCVLGCGGDRDASKRPHMAAAAQAAADQLVLTSDNPRSESPEAILADMMTGLMRTDSVRIQLDRARAVSEVVALAGAADVVLVAGKGHESTQEIMGVFHPYSDVTQVLSALQSRRECLQGVGA